MKGEADMTKVPQIVVYSPEGWFRCIRKDHYDADNKVWLVTLELQATLAEKARGKMVFVPIHKSWKSRLSSRFQINSIQIKEIRSWISDIDMTHHLSDLLNLIDSVNKLSSPQNSNQRDTIQVRRAKRDFRGEVFTLEYFGPTQSWIAKRWNGEPAADEKNLRKMRDVGQDKNLIKIYDLVAWIRGNFSHEAAQYFISQIPEMIKEVHRQM
jgi:hypothetical protein